MKAKFLIGSLTAGAALAVGLTELARSYVGALVVGLVFGVVYLMLTQRRVLNAMARARYGSENEQERYSEVEVKDFFHALSEAKTRSTAPFQTTTAKPSEPPVETLKRRSL